jgi:hypothetical protein
MTDKDYHLNRLNSQYTMCDISDTYTINDCDSSTNDIDSSDSSSRISAISDSIMDDNDTVTENCLKEHKYVKSDNIYLNNYYNSIDLAVLMNTKEEHSDDLFENITLPIMNIDYNVFIKFIYINKSRNFSCNLLDNIYKNLNFQLASELLLYYSKKFSVDINKINPIIKIKLIKECSFKTLSERIVSSVSLNKQEFITMVESQTSIDNRCITNVVYKIYSDVLKIGLNLVFKFKLENISIVNNNDNHMH